MRIALVTPAGPGMRNGNRHTALRWASFLRASGHRVAVSLQWGLQEPADAMLALHARRSYASIKAFRADSYLWFQLSENTFDTYMMIQQRKKTL